MSAAPMLPRVVFAALSLTGLTLTGLTTPSTADIASTVVDPVRISTDNLLADAGCGSEGPARNWEMENALAIDPTDQGKLVTAFIQDWQDAIVVARSSNGGRSWHQAVVPTNRCGWWLNGVKPAPTIEGHAFELDNSVNDPALAIGPSHTSPQKQVSYLSSLSLQSTPSGFVRSALVVNRSSDGGRTWSSPAVLDTGSAPVPFTGTVVEAGTHVATDPGIPGAAFVVWTKFDFDKNTSTVWFSRTDDDGASWSSRVPAAAGVPGVFPAIGRVLPVADGLLIVYAEVDTPSGLLASGTTIATTRLMAVRSSDGGRSWSLPGQIAVGDALHVTGAAVAKAPDGSAYVAWFRRDPEGPGVTPLLTRSRDGGRTWTDPKAVGEPLASTLVGLSGLPSGLNVAVAGDGTVGVTLYDHRRDDPSDGEHTMDYWLRTSPNGGETWTETHLAGPFDQDSAPDNAGHSRESAAATCDVEPIDTDCHTYGDGVLGDYNGLAGTAHGFLANGVLAHSLLGADFVHPDPMAGSEDPTDLFFMRVTW